MGMTVTGSIHQTLLSHDEVHPASRGFPRTVTSLSPSDCQPGAWPGPSRHTAPEISGSRDTLQGKNLTQP